MASSSSSSTRGMLGAASDSSTVWKLRSVSGMYHLQSYCWALLDVGRGGGTGVPCCLRRHDFTILKFQTKQVLFPKVLPAWKNS